MSERLIARAALGCTFLLASACGQTNYKVGDNMGQAGNGGLTSGGSAGRAGSGGSGGVTPQCDAPQPGSAPLSRLTRPELASTLEALLGPSDLDPELGDFDEGSYEGTPLVEVSGETVERLHRLAHRRALAISSDSNLLRALSGCDISTSNEAACKDALYANFVTRAFRRPLTDADESELDAVFEDGKSLGDGYASGARAVIEVALQSPELLYLVADGDGSQDGDLLPLTGFETASRLAYLLTGSPPDDELWQVASKGRLDDGIIAEQARRLLGSTKNRKQMRAFYEHRLGLGRLEPSSITAYTSELAELTREAGFRFVEDVTFDGEGTLRALLTSSTGYMNEALAQFYGVPNVTGANLRRVTLDPAQRRGILTQPAFLRASSPGESTRPVLRGIEVLKAYLCVTLPAPPPTIPSLPEPEPSGAMLTMRQRLTTATASQSCASCHDMINPIGLAFESYDAYGRYRESEEGAPIDASGTLERTDAKGPFANALELIDHIASSEDAARCFQQHWLTEALRRPLEDEDSCEVTRISQAFDDSGGQIASLVVAAAQSANLKYRRKSE